MFLIWSRMSSIEGKNTEKYENIFNHLDSIIFTVQEHKIVNANNKFLSFFGIEDIKTFSKKYKSDDIGKLIVARENYFYQKIKKNG